MMIFHYVWRPRQITVYARGALLLAKPSVIPFTLFFTSLTYERFVFVIRPTLRFALLRLIFVRHIPYVSGFN